MDKAVRANSNRPNQKQNNWVKWIHYIKFMSQRIEKYDRKGTKNPKQNVK